MDDEDGIRVEKGIQAGNGILTRNGIGSEKSLQSEKSIRVMLAQSWHEEEIADLYRAAGWWKEWMDECRVNDLISGSYLFAVAIAISTGKAVGMGRVISDGIADAYIQDLVVLPKWRSCGVGAMILKRLLSECRSRGITWIGLIAEPDLLDFYRSQGFLPMPGHTPMIFSGEDLDC